MSRPPHSSSSPSERAAAVAYILRTCIGPKTQVAEAALVIVKKSLVLHVRAALQPLCSLPAAVSLPAPAPQVVEFKRGVYREVHAEFGPRIQGWLAQRQ